MAETAADKKEAKNDAKNGAAPPADGKGKKSKKEKKVKEKRIVVLNESHKDMVYADKGMIGIVIQNLLANAVKFSKVGDVITVSNRDRNNNVLLCVEDTGVGISAEDQLKLFKASGFTTRGTAEEKGTGLGLAVSYGIIQEHGGSIFVDSEPSRGTHFRLKLPTRPAWG